ncbi:MAG: FMN-binding protein [Clostridia bacterium]|nr:FMN-binding protein [Clostridia bacterium]
MRTIKFPAVIIMTLFIITAVFAPAMAEQVVYYTDTSEGFGGTIEVSLGVENAEIVDVAIYAPYETDGIGTMAIDRLPAAIIEAQSWEVDGVAGASISSNGIRQAAKKCMIAAGLYEEASAVEREQVEGATYYKAAVDGFGGTVEVSIGVLDGQIVDVIATGDGETQGIGSMAIEQLPAAILESQNWDVDMVSGASVSSRAVMNAARQAMTEAGLVTE